MVIKKKEDTNIELTQTPLMSCIFYLITIWIYNFFIYQKNHVNLICYNNLHVSSDEIKKKHGEKNVSSYHP